MESNEDPMWIKASACVAFVSLPFFMSIYQWSAGSGQRSKLVIVVEKIERFSQKEARFRLKLRNTSGVPLFSTGIDFDSTHRTLDIYLEQERGEEGWQLVAPCQDTAPPHVIKLDPATPIAEERTLTVPLSRICRKRDIQLEGQFRWRVDYFERSEQAWQYLERFFEDDKEKPRPASAYSEPFEIPPYRQPPEARPNR